MYKINIVFNNKNDFRYIRTKRTEIGTWSNVMYLNIIDKVYLLELQGKAF